jgi:two-component system, OmpR family, sensor histidine kinase KdpD
LADDDDRAGLGTFGRLAGLIAAVGAVAAVTILFFGVVPAKPTTVATTYLVVILVISTRRTVVEATSIAVLAGLCFNVFFLSPVGTIAIDDAQDWVSFGAFTATGIVASQLAGRARRRNIEAVNRQQDLERLYALSRALLLVEHGPSMADAIARQIASVFALSGVALYDQRLGTVSRGGAADMPGVDALLHEVARTGVWQPGVSSTLVTAVRLGGRPIGSLAIQGAGLSDTVLQSIANLVAIGLERARGQEVAAMAEAARESSELRAAVLDAVAHDFKTPLTSIKAAASALVGSASLPADDRELVTIVGQEADRLQSLVTDAVQMLRIETGGVTLHPGRHHLAQLVAAVLGELQARFEHHVVINEVPDGLTLDADGDLARLAIRQLLDNAVKYSPAGSTIAVTARSNALVDIVVRNSGPGIAAVDQPRIFERFYRGLDARLVPGTGMGLAIVRRIAEAHGGAVEVSSAPDTGTAFTLSFPRREILL